MSKKKTIIVNPFKMWWSGDKRVEPFMNEITDTIKKYHKWPSSEFTDIYNRAYEAVYNAIKEYSAQPAPLNDDIKGDIK